MEGGVDETDPNEAKCFVWALGEFFFISSCFSDTN